MADLAAALRLGAHAPSRPRRPRVLLVSSDTFPPTRVDVTVLFGAELAGRGFAVDTILQSEARCAKGFVTAWDGGLAWVGTTDLGHSLLHRLHKHWLSIFHDLKLFSRLRSGSYDVIIVKDKFISGVLALIGASIFRCRFIYWMSYQFPEFYLTRARDGTSAYPWLYWLRGFTFKVLLYRLLLPLADGIFVQSEYMRKNIGAEGVPLAKMTAVPMGI